MRLERLQKGPARRELEGDANSQYSTFIRRSVFTQAQTIRLAIDTAILVVKAWGIEFQFHPADAWPWDGSRMGAHVDRQRMDRLLHAWHDMAAAIHELAWFPTDVLARVQLCADHSCAEIVGACDTLFSETIRTQALAPLHAELSKKGSGEGGGGGGGGKSQALVPRDCLSRSD